MNPYKILKSDLINKAALARYMWPTAKGAKVKLAHKIAGNNKQRITEKDEELIIKAIKELCSDNTIPEVKCNACGWQGDLNELSIGDEGYDACPNCFNEGELENQFQEV